MAGIDRSYRPPVTIFIDQPSAGPQALHHVAGWPAPGGLRARTYISRDDTRSNDCHAQRFQRILENVVAADLDVRQVEAFEVRDVDVGRHDVSALTDLLRQPERAIDPAPRAHFQTSPARLYQ
jgi:hypothetical protein